MSLHQVLLEQRSRRAQHRAKVDAAKGEALAAAHSVTRALLATVNRDAVVVHKNQLDLEAQARALEAETERFMQQTGRWLHAYGELNSALERIVGIEAWAQNIERRMETITENLEGITGVEKALRGGGGEGARAQ